MGRDRAGETADTTSNTETHDPDFPDRFLEFMRTHWQDRPLPDLARHEAADRFARRRDQLSAMFPGETLVIPTGVEKVRNNDCHYRFRPGSDFLWLTGEQDPDAVLVLRPAGDSHEPVLYARPRSPKDSEEFFRDRRYGELWIGRRRSLAEREEQLGLSAVSLADLDKALAELDPARTRVLRGFDSTVDGAIASTDSSDSGAADDEAGGRDAELAVALSELRLVKDSWEIAQLRDAIDATVAGFADVARALPADRSVPERLVEGIFGLRARLAGNDVGYSSIVAAGAHATTLHWISNDGLTRPGELLLLDMGVENRELYTADVTRTLPVTGTFTPLQRQVYEIVYASQQAGIDVIRPGVDFDTVHQTCMRVLAQGLADLGLLPCSVDEAMDPEAILYRRWSLHGFGHMLGLDVHDCARARRENYRDGQLDEGYVLTVEPGLYFQEEDELVPAELRGLGVRIEDDVLVTADGAENLSGGLPRQVDEVEAWLAERRAEGFRLPL